ncbi:MAG: sigma-70 family RNA polymerase sigma factor [Agathobacter sp.]|nr:sigma-70 family RNA polymerase sigma factor [Agathobacter sp.]
MYQESMRADSVRESIEKYTDMVYRLAFSMMKNKYDADDIHQEVFVQYISNYAALESEEHKKAWLIRVTVNTCKNWWKSAWQRKVCSMFDGQAVAEDDASILQWEMRNPVVEQIRKLPQKYKVVIHLFYYEEMSIKEIAEVLGLKESNVRARLTRARQKLKDSLKEDV